LIDLIFVLQFDGFKVNGFENNFVTDDNQLGI